MYYSKLFSPILFKPVSVPSEGRFNRVFFEIKNVFEALFVTLSSGLPMKSILTLFLVLMGLMAYPQPFNCGTSTVTDIDGNVYHTVQIGNQCWMKENMQTTRYPNGDPIGISEQPDVDLYVNTPGMIKVTINASGKETINIRVYNFQGKTVYQNQILSVEGANLIKCRIGFNGMYILEINNSRFKVIGDGQNGFNVELQNITPLKKTSENCTVLTDSSKCIFDYKNNPNISREYGKLYSYRAALNINSTYPSSKFYQGICPDGWHVPNDSDWMKLERSVGMSWDDVTNFGKFRGTIGDKLKTIDTTYWVDPYGTDDFGFSAKGSGFYFCQEGFGCDFHSLKLCETWWTYNNLYIMLRQITDLEMGVYRGNYYYFNVANAYSVRCVKDEDVP